MARVLLTQSEIQRHLNGLDGWEQQGNRITRTLKTKNFQHGVSFLTKIAPLADDMNHHPDVELGFKKLTFHLTTHDCGGLTTLDFELAAKLDEAWILQ
ncbi:MAG: 4a-hydroxytetrahydrobiopterin dehydratase [Sumerlaeia bacterium]